MISIVVAHSRDHVIGHQGRLPWHLPSDLRRFRELTLGRTVIMGRKTFESLPDAFRPLPERTNVVLSRNPRFRPEGAEVYPTLQAALTACARDCFVIGGGAVYAQALRFADRVYATEIDAEAVGDTFFPALAPAEWQYVDESEPLAENDYSFIFRTYARRH
ncbi:MAG TPA: dihydrofolate reductase [Conexibacter sp.]|nr:dihydrofolate reductase [Conexibacter sp.]